MAEWYLVAHLISSQPGVTAMEMGPFPSEKTCLVMLNSPIPHRAVHGQCKTCSAFLGSSCEFDDDEFLVRIGVASPTDAPAPGQ
jgi:hypothetical protein